MDFDPISGDLFFKNRNNKCLLDSHPSYRDVAQEILNEGKILLPKKVITSDSFEGSNVKEKSIEDITQPAGMIVILARFMCAMSLHLSFASELSNAL